MSFEYTPENLATFEELVTHYPDHYRRAVTLPALHLAQRQNGWCSPDVMEYIAALVGTSPAQVRDVVTFYPMFFEEPVGEHPQGRHRAGRVLDGGPLDRVVQVGPHDQRLQRRGVNGSSDGTWHGDSLQSYAREGSAATPRVKAVR